MLAPKQHRNTGHQPQKHKKKMRPVVLQRKGENAGIESKLRVGKPNDRFEKEADTVADQVVNDNSEPNVQKAPAPPVQTMRVTSTDLQRMEMGTQEEDVQMQSESENESEVQAMSDEDNEVQAMSDEDGEVQMKPITVQRAEMGTDEDDSVQMQSEAEETDVQLQSESESEDDVQTMPDEDNEVQAMSDEDGEVQAMSDEDGEVQAMSDEDGEVQMKPLTVQRAEMGTDEDDSVQMQSEAEETEVQAMSDEASEVQAKFKKSKQNKSNIASDLKSAKGGGISMDSETQSQMEFGFGHDLSNVKIHTDSKAAEMNKELGAKAFTSGSDIFFNEGEFRPDTKDGQQLLAHELTHTLQQGAVDKKLPESDTADASSDSEGASPTAESEELSRKDKKALKKAEKQEKKDAKKAAKDAKKAAKDAKKGEKEGEEEEEKKKPNPKDDPNFQAVMGNISKEGDKQKAKDNPAELGASANEAAESPENEAESFAMSDQVEMMEEEAKDEPPSFDKKTFKDMLKERIKGMMLPETLEEADDFEDHNNIDEINEAATADVKGKAAESAAPVSGPTSQEPNVTPEHQREAGELKTAKKGKKPKSVNAAIAVPPTRPPEEMEKPLADDTQRMDDRMAENDVTDHQLSISQEPKFEEALDEKNKAKEESSNMAQTLRQQESTTIQNKSAKAQATSEEQMKGMQILNHKSVKKVTGEQNKTSDKDTEERTRVAGEINALYEATKTDVNEILDNLDSKVEKDFEKASEDAKQAFEDHVDYKMGRYKSARYGGALGWTLWLKDKVMGVPDEVNVFFSQGKDEFNKVMENRIDTIAGYIVTDLNSAIKRIERGKQEVKDYVDNLPGNLKKFGKEAAEEIQDKFDELTQNVSDKQEELVDMLAEEYMAALEEVNERIEEMKAANRGLVDMVMDFIDGVIETIRKLKEMIQNLMSAIMSAIDVIMEDPIGFMENLFDGLAQGFDNFKANIQNHLLGGLLEWLTGSLGPMGIQMPDDILSLSGVFDLTLQVLGLGWDYIRLKAVKMMGEPVVKALETGFDMFKIFATKGAMGIWEYLKDKFQDIKATVIDAIKEMLITKVIEAGVKWLLSLLIPGAGFIKAIMAIKDIIVFFVESAIMLIPAITDAILALAAGNVAGVAKAMEFGLAKLISLVIGLFARLIGLGGLAKRVTKIFKKIRKRIDKAISKLLRKARKAGRKIMRKLGLGKKEKPKNKEQHDEHVKAGLQYLHAEEKKIDKDGNKAITLEEAEKVAAKTKSKFKVFKSIKPREKNGKWSYDWTGSKGTSDGKTSVEGEAERPKELQGKKTPKLDKLEKTEKGVTKRYVHEFLKVYQGSKYKVPGDIVPYVEHRAARKLGKSGESNSINEYMKAAKVSGLSKPLIDVYKNGNFTGTPVTRIPDIYKDGVVVGDVKDVQYISLDQQMQDNVRILKGFGKFSGSDKEISKPNRFDLVVRDSKDGTVSGTKVSSNLKDAVENSGGRIYEII